MRGGLPAGLYVAEAIEELTAPLFYRLLVTADPYSANDSDRVVDTWLARWSDAALR